MHHQASSSEAKIADKCLVSLKLLKTVNKAYMTYEVEGKNNNSSYIRPRELYINFTLNKNSFFDTDRLLCHRGVYYDNINLSILNYMALTDMARSKPRIISIPVFFISTNEEVRVENYLTDMKTMFSIDYKQENIDVNKIHPSIRGMYTRDRYSVFKHTYEDDSVAFYVFFLTVLKSLVILYSTQRVEGTMVYDAWYFTDMALAYTIDDFYSDGRLFNMLEDKDKKYLKRLIQQDRYTANNNNHKTKRKGSRSSSRSSNRSSSRSSNNDTTYTRDDIFYKIDNEKRFMNKVARILYENIFNNKSSLNPRMEGWGTLAIPISSPSMYNNITLPYISTSVESIKRNGSRVKRQLASIQPDLNVNAMGYTMRLNIDNDVIQISSIYTLAIFKVRFEVPPGQDDLFEFAEQLKFIMQRPMNGRYINYNDITKIYNTSTGMSGEQLETYLLTPANYLLVDAPQDASKIRALVAIYSE